MRAHQVNSGASSTCTVTFTKAAPSGGAAVAVFPNNTNLTVPASVTVASSASTATFAATCGTISTNQTATVSASLNGSSTAASLTLQVATTTSGPAAAYGFDEGIGSTTADLSGNGNTGQIMGANWTRKGKYGTALSFNGTSSYVDLGHPASLQTTGSMTWSAWVYATGNPPDDGVIVASSWELKTTPDTGARTFSISFWPGGPTTLRYSRTLVSTNTWYHVAGVYNAAAQTLDIFVNGVLDNGVLVGTVPSSHVLPSVNTTIGKRLAGSAGYYFKGMIDNVRIYTRALSAGEIMNDMNTQVRASAPVTTQMISTVAAQAAVRPPATVGSLTVAPEQLSALSCSPRTVSAGGRVTCELRTTASPTALPVRLASSSDQLKVPATVLTRANQTRLTFRASVDPTARQQSVTMTAALGSAVLQDTILVVPAAGPILTVPDRQLAKFGSPFSFTVTAVDPADLPIQLTADGVPAGASFDAASGRFEWAPTASQAGKYQVTFAATNSANQSATARVRIEVDSGLPVLTSEQVACSSGSVASLTGKWLAAPGTVLSDPTGSVMELAGTKVKVNGQYVPMVFSSPVRVSFLCPALDVGARLSVAVESDAGISDPVTATMLAASPTIFSLDGSGQNQGLISFADTTDIVMARNSQVPAHPAQPGDRIVIWATGLGSAPSASNRAVMVKLGDVYAEVESVEAVSGYAGVYTIQMCVPASPTFGDAVPVQLEIVTPEGQFQSNTVIVAIEPVS